VDAGENYLKHRVSKGVIVSSVWNRIAECLPLPNVVDFLLQGERVDRRERKTEKKADASVEHGESLTRSMLDLVWRSLDGSRVGDTQCAVMGCPGHKGQTSFAALSQTVKTKSSDGESG
jgi:hypothetical protein